MPRFLDVLIKTEWYERKSFVEATIAAEDMQVMKQFEVLNFPLDTTFILISAEKRCALYKHSAARKNAA